MARRTKLTKEVEDKIIQAIQSGATYDICAQFAGISPATFYNWMKQGRDGKQKSKVEFLERIKRAESKGAIANLGLIQRAAKDGDWKASAWLLERRHGYQRNGYISKQHNDIQELHQVEKLSTKNILQSQLAQTIKASQEALSGGSYQAFAALQRQVVHVALQLKNIDADGLSDEFENLSDDDIFEQISSIILSLPPILQQRLSRDMISLSNTKISATITEA